MRLKHPTIPPLSEDSSQNTAPKPGHKATTFRYERLSQFEGLSHEVYSRHGGISKAPFDSLNVSDETGDNPTNVNANLRIVMGIMGTEQWLSMNQVHGKDISLCREGLEPATPSVVNADAIISNQSNVALMVKSADCQAIILFDPIQRVLANVHCGWRGNTLNIIAEVVTRMESYFRCKPSQIIAGIGPSLGPCCAEFITHGEIFPKHFDQFMVRENYFDLWQISRWQLLEAGLQKENIEVASICTRCRTDLFYSYRAEGTTGRFATVAMLK